MTETVTVCICTFRRPSLFATLASLADQQLPPGIEMRIVVADNDGSDTARAGIVTRAATLGLDLVYRHAPERNISIARNACLDAADSDWIAFVDDDEAAAPDWLGRLLDQRNGHDIVFGLSKADYPDPATPAWVIAGDFHSNRIGGNDAAWNGYTANVLIDRRFIVDHALRFAVELGQIGGEDTMFFFEAHRRGARFGYAPDAVVHEPTPLARTGLRWLALRRYRSGQIHHMILQRSGATRLAGTVALAKAAVCFGSALVTAPSPTRAARHVLRGMLHVGVVASSLGIAPYREYAGRRQA